MKQFITVLLIGLLSFTSLAQTKKKNQKIIEQIENISNENDKFKEESKQVLDSITRTNYYIKENIKISKKYFENASALEDKTLTWISLAFAIITFFIASFLVGLISYGFKQAEKKYHEKLEEKLEILEKENIQTINRLVTDKLWEFDLMKKSNIILVNPKKEKDSPSLNPVLNYFNIQTIDNNINFIDIDKLETRINDFYDEQKLNIVLLENSDGGWDLNKGKNIIAAKEIALKIPNNVYLLYFGPKSKGYFPSEEKDYPENKKIINRISFVNAPSKLYSGIVDTLKYMDIIKKK